MSSFDGFIILVIAIFLLIFIMVIVFIVLFFKFATKHPYEAGGLVALDIIADKL